MATYSSALSLCYHLLVIFLVMCTILDVAASVDEGGGEDRQRSIPPTSSKQKISDMKRTVDDFREWATMNTARQQAVERGDAKLQAQIRRADEAWNEWLMVDGDARVSQAKKAKAHRMFQAKMKPILGQFKPSSDQQALIEVGELFVEIAEKWNSGVLPVNSEIDRQLGIAHTKWTTLTGASANRKLTPQEREEAAQMRKNLEKILGKWSVSVGFTKAPDTGTTLAGRLRGCLSLTLGAALLSTFLWLVGRQVFPGQSLDSLASINEIIKYSKHSGTTGQVTSSSSTVVLLATLGLVIVIMGLLLYYFSDRIWPKKKITKKRRTTKKSSQVKTGESSPTKSRESNSV